MKEKTEGTILIVDDQIELLEAYDKILKKGGYNTFTASDGKSAMEILQKNVISLVLLDVVLPDTNGFDFLRLMKSDPNLSDIFVVLISSKVKDPESQSEGLEIGADGYLIKPIEARELVARIDSYMRHKNTIDALKKSEQRFRKISDSNLDGVMIIDDQGFIHFANPAAGRMFVNDKQFLTGQQFGLPVVSKDKALINLRYQNKYDRTGELRITDIEWENQSMHLATIRDISDRLNFEKELLLAKEKAEESDRLKSAFLSNMSHEIRTPLNAIMGFSDLLESGLEEEEKRRYYSRIIKSSGEHLLRIVNDILDISKIESGQLVTESSWFEITRLLREMVYKYQSLELRSDQDVEIRLKFPEFDDQQFIYTDRSRLIQIFDNLISNALKFTFKGYIEVGYNILKMETGSKILFYVKDTGMGIPEDDLELIFQRFRQGKNIDTKGGTGLGLSITKGLLTLLEGEIWLKSEENKGTTFFFTLPYREEDYSAIFVDESGKINICPDFSGKKVLFGEDEWTSSLYLQEILRPTHIDIRSAPNGRELLKLFKNDRPDIILLDIKMPVMDGFETIRQIRKMDKEVPVIAQTAYAFNQEKEEVIKAGFNDMLTKPLNQAEVLIMMEKFLKS